MTAISVSQVQTFLLCPLKYRFRYVDQIPLPFRKAPLAFGTSLHAAIAWFHKNRMEGVTPDASEVVAIFDADWQAQNLVPLVFAGGDSQESLDEKGRELLALYVQGTSGADSPRAVEESFLVDLADPETGEDLSVRLQGIVDLVEDGTLVETKTGARLLGPQDLERHLQLSTYALAFFLTLGRIPRLRIDLLLKTKKPRIERYETSRTPSDLAWTARLLAAAAQAMASGPFFPCPSWMCGECEYYAHCQSWRG
ncbi:MAG: PD-(D/E)XK nuclease family protein [Candidatus Eisenbacteria bacterium]